MRKLAEILIGGQIAIALIVTLITAYVAEVLKGYAPPEVLGAAFLVTWLVYASDRYFKHREDETGAADDLSPARYIERHRRMFQGLFAVAALALIGLVVYEPQVLWGLTWGLGWGLAYTVELPLLKRRLKAIPYLKAIYVATVVVTTPLALMGALPANVAQASLIIGFTLLMILNAILCDLKDREGDRAAGIRTFANCTSKPVVVIGVQVLCIVAGVTLLGVVGVNRFTAALAASALALALAASRFYGQTEAPNWYYFLVIDGILVLPWGLLHIMSLINLAA